MRAGTVLCVALLLSACGHDVNEAQWKADLAEVGVEVRDWPTYTAAWERACDNDEALMYFVAVGLDAGNDPETYRVGINNACPDRLPTVAGMLG